MLYYLEKRNKGADCLTWKWGDYPALPSGPVCFGKRDAAMETKARAIMQRKDSNSFFWLWKWKGGISISEKWQKVLSRLSFHMKVSHLFQSYQVGIIKYIEVLRSQRSSRVGCRIAISTCTFALPKLIGESVSSHEVSSLFYMLGWWGQALL